jgi:hypothetical protein
MGVFLTEGLWFCDDYSLYVKEVGCPERGNVLRPLLREVETLLKRNQSMVRWAAANPIPIVDSPEEAQPVIDWWDEFGNRLIGYCRWHLLWRSNLYTGSKDLIAPAKALRKHRPEADKLSWPETTELAVEVFDSDCVGRFAVWSRDKPLIWRDLLTYNVQSLRGIGDMPECAGCGEVGIAVTALHMGCVPPVRTPCQNSPAKGAANRSCVPQPG